MSLPTSIVTVDAAVEWLSTTYHSTHGAIYISGIAFLVIRILHRIYYLLIGHRHYLSYDPKAAMEQFITSNSIPVTEHIFTCKLDGVNLRYRRLGNGPKMVLLLNGVGTNFFMWLPTLREMLRANPNLFSEITLIAPSYRGLFGCDSSRPNEAVNITMPNCVSDVAEVMNHLKIKQYHAILGWSMGAQTAITALAATPGITQRVFLLNPSTGKTLHTALQAVVPLPAFIGRFISGTIYWGRSALAPLITSSVWDVLKVIALSPVFRLILEVSAFFGGFPPGQPPFFHGYMRDVFNTREQTRGLLGKMILLLMSPFSTREQGGGDILGYIFDYMNIFVSF
jgi:pimeloyl-ACP methyl ester carboxylesterase